MSVSNRGFFAVDRTKYDELVADVGGDLAGLYVWLAANRKDPDRPILYSVKTIADEYDVDVRWVRSRLAALENLGALRWHRANNHHDSKIELLRRIDRPLHECRRCESSFATKDSLRRHRSSDGCRAVTTGSAAPSEARSTSPSTPDPVALTRQDAPHLEPGTSDKARAPREVSTSAQERRITAWVGEAGRRQADGRGTPGLAISIQNEMLRQLRPQLEIWAPDPDIADEYVIRRCLEADTARYAVEMNPRVVPTAIADLHVDCHQCDGDGRIYEEASRSSSPCPATGSPATAGSITELTGAHR